MRAQLIKLWKKNQQLDRWRVCIAALTKEVEALESDVVEGLPEEGLVVIHNKKCLLATSQTSNGILGVKFQEVERA